MLPFDRPVPKRFEWDDPDNPEHTKEIRNDVAEIARLWRTAKRVGSGNLVQTRMSRYRAGYGSAVTGCATAIYHSLEDTLRYQQLFGYTEERLVPYPV